MAAIKSARRVRSSSSGVTFSGPRPMVGFEAGANEQYAINERPAELRQASPAQRDDGIALDAAPRCQVIRGVTFRGGLWTRATPEADAHPRQGPPGEFSSIFILSRPQATRIFSAMSCLLLLRRWIAGPVVALLGCPFIQAE